MLILFLFLAVVVIARWRRWPRRRTALAAAILWAVVLAASVITVGGVGVGPVGWLIVGAAGALVWAYAAGLRHLRARGVAADAAAVAARPAVPPRLSPVELDRYARHLTLREIGGPGQMALHAAHVVVAGAGGLGAPVLLYLAAAGVGRITVADDDTVAVSNLQRQVIFRDADLFRPKVLAAAEAMIALNPHITVIPLRRRLAGAEADLFRTATLVIDGTDSFDARATINAACVAARVPLLSGAIAQWDGQLSLYDPARGAPCLACVFPDPPAPGQALPCAEAGVVGALPGVVGSLMALEAIKALTGAGDDLRGRLVLVDGLGGGTRTIAVARRAGCPVCGVPRAA